MLRLESPFPLAGAPGLRFDPGLRNARSAVVTMVATLGSFATALLIRHAAGLSSSVVILAVALAISIARVGQRADHRTIQTRILAVAVLPVLAICANQIGTEIFEHPDLGDALFVLAVSATIWARRFGQRARQMARIATLPLVSVLIVPAPVIAVRGGTGDTRLWSALIALVALMWVTTIEAAAERSGVIVRAVAEPQTPVSPTAAARSRRRVSASTSMALQMAVALAGAFAVGRALFGTHWTWAVLTAFIVCSGNRGRGDVVHKAAMRLAGAAVGTLAATILTGVFPPGDAWSIVVIFAVLTVALWLRPINYGFWAAGMTAALALLYGYYDERGISLLGARLEAILAGAALAVAASWFLLPVRTTDVVRRDIGVALAALDRYLASLQEDGASSGQLQTQFIQAVGTLEHARTLLRAVPSRLRPRLDQLPVLAALERCAAELPAVSALLAEGGPAAGWDQRVALTRRHLGKLRRDNAQQLPPDPSAWERLADCIHGLSQAQTPSGTDSTGHRVH